MAQTNQNAVIVGSTADGLRLVTSGQLRRPRVAVAADSDRRQRRRIILSPDAGGSETGTNNNVAELINSLFVAPHSSLTITGFPLQWCVEQVMDFCRQHGSVAMTIETTPGSFIVTYSTEAEMEAAQTRLGRDRECRWT